MARNNIFCERQKSNVPGFILDSDWSMRGFILPNPPTPLPKSKHTKSKVSKSVKTRRILIDILHFLPEFSVLVKNHREMSEFWTLTKF